MKLFKSLSPILSPFCIIMIACVLVLSGGESNSFTGNDSIFDVGAHHDTNVPIGHTQGDSCSLHKHWTVRDGLVRYQLPDGVALRLTPTEEIKMGLSSVPLYRPPIT